MKTYAELLEESYEEAAVVEVPANDTFKAIDSFMAENFNMLISEASNFEVEFGINDIVFEDGSEEINKEGTMKKIGAAVKTAAENLVKKIEAFLAKIPEAIQRVVAKANAVLAMKSSEMSNATVAKIIEKDPEAVLKKDVTVNVPKNAAKVKEISNKLATIANTIMAIKIGGIKAGDKVMPLSNTESKVISDLSAFEKDITADEAFFEDKELKAGEKIAVAYKEADFKGLSDIAAEALKSINATSKEAMNTCKAIKDDVKKAISDTKALGIEANSLKENLTKTSEVAGATMKVTVYSLNFLSNILKVIAKNNNRIAINAKLSSGEDAAVVKKAEA